MRQERLALAIALLESGMNFEGQDALMQILIRIWNFVDPDSPLEENEEEAF